MERVVIRIDNIKGFVEYGKPVLIFIDAPVNINKVLYCACTGHGEGDYNALIQQTRPITDEELKYFNNKIYGYNLNNFKVVKKFIR